MVDSEIVFGNLKYVDIFLNKQTYLCNLPVCLNFKVFRFSIKSKSFHSHELKVFLRGFDDHLAEIELINWVKVKRVLMKN